MKIDKNTKILNLLEENPHLLKVLTNISPEFNKLKNPLLRKTLGRFATFEHAAEMSGLSYDEFHRRITAAMIHAPVDDSEKGPPLPEEREARIATLKEIVKGLHEGKAPEEQKARFARLLQEVSASEIAEMEQALIKDGIGEDEIKNLCDVHVQVFSESFGDNPPEAVPPGHPVHTFRLENRALGEVTDRMRMILPGLAHLPDEETLKNRLQELDGLLTRLSEIEKHYIRKENQLFPVLEDHEITGPSRVMWALHDDIRALLKGVRGELDEGQAGDVEVDGQVLTTAVSNMIYKEENILFPMALEILSDSDWGRVLAGSDEIGYALVAPAGTWLPVEGPLSEAPPERHGAGNAPLWLSTGGLTPKQLDLVMTNLPVDITFVDAEDRVQYYSANRDRVFPRSPGIIGRAVQNCHPPDSVHIVQKILDAFRNGAKDNANFWIRMNGRFLFIRYYAIRDEGGDYVGCLEVTEDVTEIRALEGERRLLDW